MEQIRLGVIGCGRVADERHLPALGHVPRIGVVAATDLDRRRAEQLATRWGIGSPCSDAGELLGRDDVDAVAILTPTSSHAELATAALEAGKHVLVEKPLALTMDECDGLVRTAAASDRTVMVGFNLRWHPLIRRARAMVRRGDLGEIRAIRSVYTHARPGEGAPDWHRKLDLGGGVSFNEGVHHYDLWRFLLDAEVRRVSAFSAPSEHFEDETCVTTAELSGGTLATGVFSFTTAPNSEVEVYGTRGRLVVNGYRFDGLELFDRRTYPGDPPHRATQVLASLGRLPRAVQAMRRGGDFQATFVGLWRHFADCVLHGGQTECSVADGRLAVQVALATIRSARSGRPVDVTKATA